MLHLKLYADLCIVATTYPAEVEVADEAEFLQETAKALDGKACPLCTVLNSIGAPVALLETLHKRNPEARCRVGAAFWPGGRSRSGL